MECTCGEEKQNKDHCASYRWNIVPEVVSFMRLENGHFEVIFRGVQFVSSEVWFAPGMSSAKR